MDAPVGTASESPAPSEALVKALRRLLRPLVRLLLAYQLTFPFIANLLKSLFVEVATSEFQLEGKRQTVSRISLLTGIHRKDVKRLGSELEAGAEDAVPESISLGAQLVAQWTGAAPFLDAEGRPRPLCRVKDPAAGPAFEDLVVSVSKDIHHRSILDEWIRLGVVEVDDQGRVILKTEAFVPSKGFDEKAYYLGRSLRDHIAAASHNLMGGSPPFLERNVSYASLAAESVEELAMLSAAEGMQALRKVNERARELKSADQSNPERRRFSFGVYFYETDAGDAGPGSEGDED
jgi:hypothetical protein